MKKQQMIYMNKAIKNPTLLTSVSDLIKARIIEGLLNESDIPYYTKDNNSAGYIKVLMGSAIYGTDFYVGKDDYTAAKDIIDAYFDEPEAGTGNPENDAESDPQSHKTVIIIMRIILGIFLLAFIAGTVFILTQMLS